MKMAQGYVTEDGTFFERKVEAELYEAEMKIREHTPANVDPNKLLEIFIALMPQIRRFTDAYIAAHPPKVDNATEQDREAPSDGLSPEASASTGHLSSAEEDLAALLKLPARGPSNVRHVGSGSRTEKVQDRRQEHGPRVRGTDASSVRRRKDMAVKQDPEA